jgi:uncharacterized protein
MRITSIIWLEAISDKLAFKHGVRREEVREVFNRAPRFRFVEKGNNADEDLYAALGHTMAGRYLIVFFIYKKDGSALIISGRDMSDKERRLYDKK